MCIQGANGCCLLLYALALGVYSYAAVPRPLGSSFTPLRRTHQAPRQRAALRDAADRLTRWQERVDGALSEAA